MCPYIILCTFHDADFIFLPNVDLKFLPLIIIPLAVAVIPCMYLLKQRRHDKIIDVSEVVTNWMLLLSKRCC